MENKIPQQYIADIAKATTYFSFNNGPIKDLINEGKLSEEEIQKIQAYMQNHLAYLYTVLLEENNVKKFELITNTMNKFYVNDKLEVQLEDDGFNKFFDDLFPKTSNINIKL